MPEIRVLVPLGSLKVNVVPLILSSPPTAERIRDRDSARVTVPLVSTVAPVISDAAILFSPVI